VVAELQRTKGAKVRLTLEVDADAEEGFNEIHLEDTRYDGTVMGRFSR